ncbi:MAG: 1-(5-phosphoribosyl)-5-[(5-phosphoribosylamino)methylideneamino]imidazole-4-carboxamide isomerase [Planctomycetes bacterium]|nr:1-(5-phosphoribosyl)-5-[(5-phosphoribosylamino)methylideneamino]imidazole-4-carboxamide isomerase [Planctomycetota bacterium]
MLIIPAIDLRGGKCVRLTQGKRNKEIVYSDDPILVAKQWRNQGAKYLHVVDLDGAFEGEPRNLEIIKEIVKTIDIPIEVGGGIRTDETALMLLESGVDRIVIGTRAVDSPEWIYDLCRKYPTRIAVGIDAMDGKVAVKGWTNLSESSILDVAKEVEKAKPRVIIFTNIKKDGMLQGPDITTARELTLAVKTPIIVSGGIASLKDVEELSTLLIEGMIIGKALYSGNILLSEAIRIAL